MSTNRYNPEFCSLIGANHDCKYTRNTILELLISHSQKTNIKMPMYKFNGKLKTFLDNIKPEYYLGITYGYNKSHLNKILNSLIISSIDSQFNKYVIISASKSNIPVIQLDITL
jgi:hypothetical protein